MRNVMVLSALWISLFLNLGRANGLTKEGDSPYSGFQVVKENQSVVVFEVLGARNGEYITKSGRTTVYPVFTVNTLATVEGEPLASEDVFGRNTYIFQDESGYWVPKVVSGSSWIRPGDLILGLVQSVENRDPSKPNQSLQILKRWEFLEEGYTLSDFQIMESTQVGFFQRGGQEFRDREVELETLLNLVPKSLLASGVFLSDIFSEEKLQQGGNR